MTIREIAERCGVSRGTVDRVLNGRGKVRPETERKIRAALEEASYSKNIAARALTVRKAAPVIGVLLSSVGNPFFDEVIAGIRKAEADLDDYGVTVALTQMQGYDTAEQLRHIAAMEGRIAALVIQPVNDPRIAQKVAALDARGVPVVTVNSDLEGSLRKCYVGSDYRQGGRTAAGIVRLATGGEGRLGILTGVPMVLGHVERLGGFLDALRSGCPGMIVSAMESAQDDSGRAYEAARRMLAADPGIDTMVVIAAGLAGVCRAVLEAGRENTVRLFAFDNIPGTREFMERDLLKAVVCQQPYEQGYQAVRAAYDVLLTGKAEKERRIMENEIKVLENLEEAAAEPASTDRT